MATYAHSLMPKNKIRFSVAMVMESLCSRMVGSIREHSCMDSALEKVLFLRRG
jgi:hypothetical protein